MTDAEPPSRNVGDGSGKGSPSSLASNRFLRGSWRSWARLLRRRLRWWLTGRLVGMVMACGVFLISLWVIARELRGFEYTEVWAYLQELPLPYVLIALGLTALTFVVLTGYDALALRYIGAELSSRRIAFAAFVGYAVSQALGNPILTGGSVRYRLYTLWGFAPSQVAKAILFAGVSFWLGFCTLGGVVLVAGPAAVVEAVELPVSSVLLGTIILAPAAIYAGITVSWTAPIEWGGWTFEIPPEWMLPVQVGLAAGDLLLASSVVYVLLPPEIGVSLSHVIVAYLLALLAGLVSHVPGGLGVFESVMLLMLTPTVPAPVLLGALLAYRGIFHLLPLVVAAIAFAAYELRRGVRTMNVEDPP